MRKELRKIGKEERHQFKATFKRYGTKQSYKGSTETTLLFINIQTLEGKEITDHLWFNNTKMFQALNLKENDVITFFARVATYNKTDIEDIGSQRYYYKHQDYKLSYPTKASKILEDKIEPLELSKEEIEYNRIYKSYIKSIKKQINEFFQRKRKKLSFEECFEVFKDAPTPSNEVEKNAYNDKINALQKGFAIKKN